MNCNEWSRPRPALPDNLLHRDEALYIAELQRFIRTIPDENGNARYIAIDGIYGPETRQAVTSLQRQYGLNPTGRADQQTWDIIFSEYERLAQPHRSAGLPPFVLRTLKPGDSGVEVLIMQALINQLSEKFHNISPVPFTGDYDSGTVMATEQLQELLRLPADGIIDSAVWEAAFGLLRLSDTL